MATRRATPLTDRGLEDNTPAKSPHELRVDACNGILQITQLGCITFGLFSDAGAIGVFGPNLVEETVKLADNNRAIAKRLDLLVEVGPYAGLVGAAIPFVAQILVNHGIVKPEMFANAGVVSPDALEAQMKANMMRQAMEMKRQQQEVEEEMRRMSEEMMSNASANGNGPTAESNDD